MSQPNANWLCRPAVRWTLLALVALIVWTLTFFLSRDAGIKDGQRQARQEIMQTDSITAGPDRLLEQQAGTRDEARRTAGAFHKCAMPALTRVNPESAREIHPPARRRKYRKHGALVF